MILEDEYAASLHKCDYCHTVIDSPPFYLVQDGEDDYTFCDEWCLHFWARDNAGVES